MATRAAAKSRQGGGNVRVVATNAVYGKLCRESLRRLPARFRDLIDLQTFGSLKDVRLPRRPAAETVYVSRLDDLPGEGAKQALRATGEARHLLFLAGLPVEAMPARLLQLDIRNPHRLHLAAERSPDLVGELINRLFSGMMHADGPRPIVDAWVENENLVLLSPTFDRLVVPLDKLSKLIGSDAEQVQAFDIDEDGRFLHWPHADVHLGWEQCLQLVDPAAALAAKQKSDDFNRRYGAAIRALREASGLKQSEIRGVTERHLRRVEHGQLPAKRSTLTALAEAHRLPLDEYLKKLAVALRDDGLAKGGDVR
jgi:hypothetical protein